MTWRRKPSGNINACIVPYDNPDEWYFHEFPNNMVMEAYALAHGLSISEDKNDEPDSP